MADLADKQIREAKLEIYACQNADEKLRFDMRHALRYVFSRERVIKARQALRSARRVTPDPAWERRVKRTRLAGWLIALSVWTAILSLITMTWYWLVT